MNAPAPRSPRGAVLVTVLGGVVLIGAIVFAALFAATLETLGARSAARALEADAALEGALALAAAEVLVDPGRFSGPEAPAPRRLGPWLGAGVPAVASLEVPVPGLVRLVASLPGSPFGGRAELVLAVDPPAVRFRP